MRSFILLAVTAALLYSATPAIAQVSVGAQAQANGPDAWRYKWHNNQWWYYTPQEQWMYHNGNSWQAHHSAAVNSYRGNSPYYQGNANNQYRYQSGYRGNYNGNGYYNNGYGYGGYGNGNGGNGYGGNGYGGNVGTAILGRVLGGRW